MLINFALKSPKHRTIRWNIDIRWIWWKWHHCYIHCVATTLCGYTLCSVNVKNNPNSTTTTTTKSAISRIKTRIRALRWHWTVLGGVSSRKKLRFQSTFKTRETVSRSSVSRKRVPDGCSDSKSMRRKGSDRLWSLKLWRCRRLKRSSRLVVT